MERITQKLDEARKHRENIEQGYASSDALLDGHSYILEKGSGTGRRGNNSRKLLMVAAVIIALVIIILWIRSSNKRAIELFSDIEIYESRQAIRAVSATVEKMNEKMASLTAQMDALSESINQLQASLISTPLNMDAVVAENELLTTSGSETQQTIAETVHIHESLSLAGSDKTRKETSTAIAPPLYPDKSATDSTVAPAAMESQSFSTTSEIANQTGEKGPWVINLVSTSSKAEADRLSKMALSKEIQTEQQQITVKGTQFWRVQITGFSTRDNARAYADTAKQTLGLNEVWILKR